MLAVSEQKTIIIYQSYLCQIGGVETFLYNWCLNLRNYYDITVLYGSGDAKQIKRLKKLVKMQVYDKNKQYTCDIFIRNSVWGEIPNNVISKDNRYLEMRHANYKHLLKQGKLYEQYHKFDKTNEVIGCGEFVSRISDEVLHDQPVTIKNILAPKQKTNKILKLISCTRIDSEKGWSRMLHLMNQLRLADIKFEWNIFTNSDRTPLCEEVHFYKPRFDIWDYLADADYTVLLSDSEGLPYTVQESLQYQVPCIVTDIEGCTELVQDGVNGYVVPLNMDFDVRKLLKIPKCPEYDNHALEKWLDYLGDGVYIEKEEEKDMKYEVAATTKYQETNTSDVQLSQEESTKAGKNIRVVPKAGRRWVTDKERAEMLKEKGFVMIIKEIKEEVKKEAEEEPIKEPKKSTKRTSKKSKAGEK